MNVTELSRRLHIHPKELLDVLPEYGFDIGKKAVKIDDKVAMQIMKEWKRIKRDLEDKKRREMEENKRKEKEMRKEKGMLVKLPDILTVKEFAEKLEMPVTQVIVELMKNGILANQNQNIDYDTGAIIAGELGFSVEKRDESQSAVEKEREREEVLEKALSRGGNLKSRPPVVVVMGHVDHGKTKLLDTIREANIIETESGGITQHMGAYQTVWKDPKTKETRLLTFLDTPGHEAFTLMRSRGAKVADMAILVVAADDGVKPQTEEAIQIIKAAKLPFVVALNKIDKEGADAERVKTQLSQKNIIPEEWGGDVPVVPISAKENLNIDKLLDALLLLAYMNAEAIKADPELPAVGTIIESHMDKNIGAVATVLIQAGSLKKGDNLIINKEVYGKVRAIKDYKGEYVEEALPSTPVQIVGLKVAPEVGDVLDNSFEENAIKVNVKQKRTEQTGAQKTGVSKFSSNEGEEVKNTLNLIVKADVLGSLEAIIGSLEKMEYNEVAVKIIGKGLGNIMENDVSKAEAGNAAILGFHVIVSPSATDLIRSKNVKFLRFEIIYDLIDWVKVELEKLLEKEKVVKDLGKLEVLAIFRKEKRIMTIGGLVLDGKAVDKKRFRIVRKGNLEGYGTMLGLQTGKQEVKEVPSGTQCGLRIESRIEIQKGDVLEFFSEETRDKKLER